jgi:hypothetical protein
MAFGLHPAEFRRVMGWKLKRKKTRNCEERIKSLEDRLDGTVERLDAAVAESRRLGKALDELLDRDPMRQLRKTLKKRFGPSHPSDLHTYDPDDTVN